MRWRYSVLLQLKRSFAADVRSVRSSAVVRRYSDDGGSGKGIVVSTTMFQTGTGFDELPVAFQKSSGCEALAKQLDAVRRSTVKSKPPSEVGETIGGFQRCSTIRDLLRLLATVPTEDVTPAVALEVLKKLIELENNTQFRNEGFSADKLRQPHDHHQPENFTRSAVAATLVGKLISDRNSDLLLDALRTFHKDYSAFPEVNAEHVVRLGNELMLRAVNCDLSFCQCAELALHFHKMNDEWATGLAEKLWLCMVDKAHEIDDGSKLVLLFRVLPTVKQSRGTLSRIAQEKTGQLFYTLSSAHVVAILESLSQLPDFPVGLLATLSHWLEVHLHTVSEADLVAIVPAFSRARYLDTAVRNSLTRYMKSRRDRISDHQLVAVLANYCKRVKLRCPVLLDHFGEYFAANARRGMSPVQIKAVVEPFGLLAYTPTNSFEVFEALEKVLSERFVQFKPGDALDILLACVYIERYPLNFVRKVFNPFFLDRVHTSAPEDVLSGRRKLKLLDTALCLECPEYYRGPMLPRDVSAKSTAFVDGRLRRLHEALSDVVARVASDAAATATAVDVETSVLLPTLPFIDLYRIDFLVRRRGFKTPESRSGSVAVLVHLPEDYAEDKSSLLGPHLMRHKHLRLHGYRTLAWDYDKLQRMMAKEHEQKLEKFIGDGLKSCLQ